MTKLYVLFDVTGGQNTVMGVFESLIIPYEDISDWYGGVNLLSITPHSYHELEFNMLDSEGNELSFVMDEYTLNQIG